MKPAIFSALAAVTLTVASLQADGVDAYIEKQLKAHNIPGLSLAVVRDGKIEKAKGYGLADVELNVPATEETAYQWASVTKQFTAAAVLLLVQDGKLSLDDLVSRHYEKSPSAWSNITVRHLLTHTAGIKSYTDLPDFFKTIRKDYTPDELIGLVSDRALDFDPGEKWRYNNTAYYLLGLIIERASGQTYGDFLAERIFKPLQMDTARLNHQFEIIPNRATGYDNRSNRWMRSEFVSPTQPYSAGALIGTVLDLAKWDAALYTDKLLPASVREEMWRAVKLQDGKTFPYGYGWQLGELRGHPYVGHGGGIHGFSTFILRLVKDKLTVIVLANSSANPERIARGVADTYVPGLSITSVSPQTDPDPELSQKLKECLMEMAEKKDCPMLTPEFRRSFSNSRRRFAALQKDLKELKSFTFIISEEPSEEQKAQAQRQDIPVAKLCSYKVIGADNEPRYYVLALTPENKIAAFDIED